MAAAPLLGKVRAAHTEGSVRVAASGSFVLSGGPDGALQLSSSKRWAQAAPLWTDTTAHNGAAVTAVALDAAAGVALTASGDGVVVHHTAVTTAQPRHSVLCRVTGSVHAVAFCTTAGVRRALVAGDSVRVFTWTEEKVAVAALSLNVPNPVLAAAFSPCGAYVAVGSSSGAVGVLGTAGEFSFVIERALAPSRRTDEAHTVRLAWLPHTEQLPLSLAVPAAEGVRLYAPTDDGRHFRQTGTVTAPEVEDVCGVAVFPFSKRKAHVLAVTAANRVALMRCDPLSKWRSQVQWVHPAPATVCAFDVDPTGGGVATAFGDGGVGLAPKLMPGLGGKGPAHSQPTQATQATQPTQRPTQRPAQQPAQQGPIKSVGGTAAVVVEDGSDSSESESGDDTDSSGSDASALVSDNADAVLGDLLGASEVLPRRRAPKAAKARSPRRRRAAHEQLIDSESEDASPGRRRYIDDEAATGSDDDEEEEDEGLPAPAFGTRTYDDGASSDGPDMDVDGSDDDAPPPVDPAFALAASMGPVVRRHPPLQCGATPPDAEGRRFLAYNAIGAVRVLPALGTTVVFHDKSRPVVRIARRNATPLMAALGPNGAVFVNHVVPDGGDAPYTELYCRTFHGLQTEWDARLPDHDAARCLAVGRRYVAVALESGALHILSLSGLQRALLTVPRVVCLNGAGTTHATKDAADPLLVVQQAAAGPELTLHVLDAEKGGVALPRTELALTPAMSLGSPAPLLRWVGWADDGALLSVDDAGVVRLFSHDWGGAWQPIHRTSPTDPLWIWGAAGEKLWAVRCSDAEPYPAAGTDLPPTEFVTAVPPLLHSDRPGLLRGAYLSRLAKLNDTKRAAEFYTEAMARADKTLDHVLLQHFRTAAEAEHMAVAADLAAEMQLIDSVEAAARWAHDTNKAFLRDTLLRLLQMRNGAKRRRLCDLPVEGQALSAKDRERVLRRLARNMATDDKEPKEPKEPRDAKDTPAGATPKSAPVDAPSPAADAVTPPPAAPQPAPARPTPTPAVDAKTLSFEAPQVLASPPKLMEPKPAEPRRAVNPFNKPIDMPIKLEATPPPPVKPPPSKGPAPKAAKPDAPKPPTKVTLFRNAGPQQQPSKVAADPAPAPAPAATPPKLTAARRSPAKPSPVKPSPVKRASPAKTAAAAVTPAVPLSATSVPPELPAVTSDVTSALSAVDGDPFASVSQFEIPAGSGVRLAAPTATPDDAPVATKSVLDAVRKRYRDDDDDDDEDGPVAPLGLSFMQQP